MLKNSVKTSLISKLNISEKDITISLQPGSIKFIISFTSKTSEASETAQTDFNDANKIKSFLKEATNTDYTVTDVFLETKSEITIIQDTIKPVITGKSYIFYLRLNSK